MPAKRARRTSRHKASPAEHRRWLCKAFALARQPVDRGGSPHPNVKVGAILVDARGRKIYGASNGFALGVDRNRTERLADNHRSLWINCAEQLAIAGAARRGIPLKGAKLYLTLEPCTVCAGLMIEAGVRELIIPAGAARNHKRLKPKWKRSIEAGLVKLKEAGVRVTAIESD